MDVIEYVLRDYYKKEIELCCNSMVTKIKYGAFGLVSRNFKTENNNVKVISKLRNKLLQHGCVSVNKIDLSSNKSIWTLKIYNNKTYIYESSKSGVKLVEVR